MGISFEDTHGSAKKNTLEYVKLEFGPNQVRMVGDLRARYAYWKKLKNNNIPVECLSFDPEEERFTNKEKDWFKHYYPAEKCVWSYVCQVIDKNGELKLFGLKKKLFDQIMDAASKLGDPTDIENGWTVYFTKKKTGPNPFNVEYVLDVLMCSEKKGPIPEEWRGALEGLKPIDELVPRLTAEQQKTFIEDAWINPQEEKNTSSEAISELANGGDVPF